MSSDMAKSKCKQENPKKLIKLMLSITSERDDHGLCNVPPKHLNYP